MSSIKRIAIVINIVFFILLLPLMSFGNYLIELKNGNEYVTYKYWEKGNQIYFYIGDGVIGFNKEDIKEIRESGFSVEKANKRFLFEKKKESGSGEKESQSREKESETGEKEKRIEKKANKIKEETNEEKQPDRTFYQNKKLILKKSLEREQEQLQIEIVQYGQKNAKVTRRKRRIGIIKGKIAKLSVKVKEKNDGVLPFWWYEL